MAIIYSLIARNNTVLAEFTEKKGNFQQVSKQILEKIPSRNTKVSYLYDNYVFHICVDSGFTFFCMSEKEFGNRIPFAFLEDIKEKFLRDYAEKGRIAEPLGLNREFKKVLKKQMEYFSNSQQSDKLSKVKGQIQEVKGIMIDNIEKVLNRGEKIDLLVGRTQDLSDSAQDFRYRSKKLKNTMWWRNVKLILILLVIVALVIGAIVWFVCGFPAFHNCRAWFGPGSGSQ